MTPSALRKNSSQEQLKQTEVGNLHTKQNHVKIHQIYYYEAFE